MAEINQQDPYQLQLVMAYEIGTRSVHVYRGSVCDWYVLRWDGKTVKAIEWSCAQQALEVFDRCLGQPVGEA